MSANAAPPTVVIVGRPNVGKSTLFNRLCESRRALTSPIAGTTRDWLEGDCHWNGRLFRVIDTGGYSPGNDDVLTSVRAQVEEWIRRADAVVWVVDAGEGLTAADQSFARLLRPQSKRVIVVVNKSDDARRDTATGEFARLGFSPLLGISVTHGRRINGLLEMLEEKIPRPADAEAPSSQDEIRVAIVGRPNVGKSSLVNCLLGEKRMIVSDVPGTTRDTVDTRLERDGRRFVFVDTAGLRAKKSKADALEGLTRLMAERALDRCEVALLLVDVTSGMTEGDVAVGRLIDEKARASVVGINKWDLISDTGPTIQYYRSRAGDGMPFLAYSPLVFLSAKTGEQVDALLKALAAAHEEFHRRLDDEEVTAFFWRLVQDRPYSRGGQKLKFYRAAQVGVAPPTIVIKTNMDPADIHFSYERHLERAFRAAYGFAGSPVHLKFKRGKA